MQVRISPPSGTKRVHSVWRPSVETVAFYSYKGGVGRSLMVAHAASFFGMLGKRVVVVDLDLEAPGLHYKFRIGGSFSGGVVPYLLAGTDFAVVPSLGQHLLEVLEPTVDGGKIWLMPAGPAPHPHYWTALKALGERLPFGGPSDLAFLALLDLFARIEEELDPDYLLIDARTGVTELGSLATTLLADTVFAMFTPSLESIEGTATVIRALQATPRIANKGPIRIVPVLSRAGKKVDSDVQTALDQISELCKPEDLHRLPHDSKVLESEFVGWKGPLPLAYAELLGSVFFSRQTFVGYQAVRDLNEGKFR